MATENQGKSKVGKIDVTENMELAVKYGIAAVPTILVFKGGEVVERIQGFREKSELQGLLDTHSTSA